MGGGPDGTVTDPATQDLRLGPAALSLYEDLRLAALLCRLLEQSARLLGSVAGNVSIVDGPGGRYLKVAERGAACSVGQTFPLWEGITGQVVSRRRPVVLPRYSDLATAHLPRGHSASRGAAAAVPIWWRGEVIGTNVAFAGTDRSFTSREVDDLELLSQVAAAGMVFSGQDDPTLSRLREVPARAGDGDRAESGGLTPREQQVLRLVAQGLTDRQVAEVLVLAPKTVEKHVGSLLRKTGATTRTAAVVRALERGLLAAGGETPG